MQDDVREAALAITTTDGLVPISSNPTGMPDDPFASMLGKLLFGPCTGREAPSHCYAVLDGTRVPNLLEHLEASQLPHASLLPEDEIESLGTVGPWLARLDQTAPLTRSLFSRGEPFMAFWDSRPGIFLRSSAGISELAAHLRPIAKTRNSCGHPTYFRFWEPKIAASYLSGIVDWPDRVDVLFSGPRIGNLEFLVPAFDVGRMIRFARIGQPSTRSRQPFTLEARDEALLAQSIEPQIVEDLATWLETQNPKLQGLSLNSRKAVAAEGLRVGRMYGLGFREEVAQLLYMMSFLGMRFDLDPLSRPFHRMLKENRSDRYRVMRMEFPEVWSTHRSQAATPRAVDDLLLRACDNVEARTAGWNDLAASDVERVALALEQRLAHPADAIAAARQDLGEACTRLTIEDDRDRWLCYVMRLVLGIAFDSDPMHPWLERILTRRHRRATRSVDAARVGYRILRRRRAIEDRQ